MKRIYLILCGLILAGTVAAQKTVVPIVQFDINEASSTSAWGSLLGGVENGKFLDAKTTFGKMKNDDKFSFFNFKSGRKGEFSLDAFREGPGACPENYFSESEINVVANFAVGANASWEVLPRKWQTASLTNANYKKAVADVLRQRGLAKSPVKIEQAVRVDLDGDGADEILLIANHDAKDASLNSKTGSYSMFIVQKTSGGKVRNILLGGNFFTKRDVYYAGEYSISGIADFNGDGKMEVLVVISGYEEDWVKVFEMKGGSLIEIKALSYYCGA
jgi:hypothetical protein